MGKKTKSKFWSDYFYLKDHIDACSNDEDMDMDISINGFQVYPIDVDLVKQIFERHPDLASDFHIKTEKLKSSYMDLLLNLIVMLLKSPRELTEQDLDTANNVFSNLVHAGFKLDWLKKKLEEVCEKKKKGEISEVRIKELQEELSNLKVLLSDLEEEIDEELANIVAAKTCFGFNDVV